MSNLTPSHRPSSAPLRRAAALVPEHASPRRAAWVLLGGMTLFVMITAVAPWQQNIQGEGEVIALSPDDRQQTLESPISGRVMRWHVAEGERVDEGQLLVELADLDPNRLERLNLERDAQQARVTAYEDQVSAQRQREEALARERDARLQATEAEIRVARERLQAKQEMLASAEARRATTSMQVRRITELNTEGLASRRDLELAELAVADAEATMRSANAGVRGAREELQAKRATLEQVRASADAGLRSAHASLRGAETQLASAQASLLNVEGRIAQQESQRVRAPREGIVQHIFARQGSAQVSRGQVLAHLVPTTAARAIQLQVDGNDAALLAPGRQVRLQFEGWPAVQFSGWPSVAVGTFGGRVSFVDSADDGRGDFRVVVVPDEADEPWPDARFLRQGTRAKGWVLLDEVSVGFEIWRRLNGFPPRLASGEEGAS